MGTLSLLLPLSLSFPLRPNRSSSRRNDLPKSPSWPRISSNTLDSARIRGKTIVFGGNSSSTDPNESQFFDENGVVDDMDGYLNSLSLEYDSVWDTKPSWCQPWTITLTGVLAIAFSWLILHSVVVTSIVLFLTCSWWYIFLYSYPKAYAEMIAERRKKVINGVEDTYGLRKI
ncbi:hypothetical protein JCGZ_21920 [Jatropha curcas]|uniref:DUF6737 domain-containing protein n=1 Tax=Jatropha curcas TaxID=180498 RepID=A0A067JPI0_JATCU|nr:uncharacterized protein LOC105649982 [Jatropha curcas]KDP21449.1 hypothetical protein JCGZ_21920 [Jatropha curcas]